MLTSAVRINPTYCFSAILSIQLQLNWALYCHDFILWRCNSVAMELFQNIYKQLCLSTRNIESSQMWEIPWHVFCSILTTQNGSWIKAVCVSLSLLSSLILDHQRVRPFFFEPFSYSYLGKMDVLVKLVEEYAEGRQTFLQRISVPHILTHKEAIRGLISALRIQNSTCFCPNHLQSCPSTTVAGTCALAKVSLLSSGFSFLCLWFKIPDGWQRQALHLPLAVVLRILWCTENDIHILIHLFLAESSCCSGNQKFIVCWAWSQ